MTDQPPKISVVVIVHRATKTLTSALEYLRAQTIADRLEVILVTPDAALTPDFQAPRIKVIAIGPIISEGAAKAAGIRAATADYVAFIEDHSFPERRWAEALLKRHGEGDYAAVGPVVGNANPWSATSWGCFLIFYGQWMAARPEQEVRHLPANQSCYRREILLGYGEDLASMLEAESVLHYDLLNRGYRISQTAEARIMHLNFSRMGSVLREYFLASRVFALKRRAQWPLWRRVVYAGGSWLLPLIRLPRALGDGRRGQVDTMTLTRAIAPVFIILCAGAAGEMLGYTLGEGKAKERLFLFVSHQGEMFNPNDIKALEHQETDS